ncbi:MAG: tetratricopeptide repeat protein [Anaerolineae bacterium]
MLLFDFISFIYVLNSLRVLWQLFKNWRTFWDAEVTPADLALAGRVAFFVFIPLGVFLHEAGHALATWQVGGQVVDFQWRVFWGYIIPEGDFTPLQDWWIALSGNLVSILLGLLPIPLVTHARTRIQGELLYSFAKQELFYALVWYPVLSFTGLGGDWVTIYDFSVAPYAQITLLLHLALLYGLWRLEKGPRATRWRLGRHPGALSTLQNLEAEAAANPGDVRPQANLAYFYHRVGESGPSQRHERQAERLAPDDTNLKVVQALIAHDRGRHHRAQQAARAALMSSLTPEDQVRMHGVLAFSLMHQGRQAEALSHFDTALALSADDANLYYWRATLKRAMGRREEARLDFEQAARLAPDEHSRARARRELES